MIDEFIIAIGGTVGKIRGFVTELVLTSGRRLGCRGLIRRRCSDGYAAEYKKLCVNSNFQSISY